jgi:hypothetical protein
VIDRNPLKFLRAFSPDEKGIQSGAVTPLTVSGLIRAALRIYCGESFLYDFTLHSVDARVRWRIADNYKRYSNATNIFMQAAEH